MPDDDLDRPANNRNTILPLPGITQDDIDEVYDRWTEIRVANTLKQYGSSYVAEHRTDVSEAIHTTATAG